MDSILVIDYSFTGVSRRAAELLSSHHGWPLGEVQDERSRSTLRCVLDTLLHRHPRVRYVGPGPDGFRTIVLVTPIWMMHLAAPMRVFLTEYRDAFERVAVVVTMGGAGASNALGEIARILGKAPIASAAFTQRELETGAGTARLLAFGDALQPGRAPGAGAQEAPAQAGPSPEGSRAHV